MGLSGGDWFSGDSNAPRAPSMDARSATKNSRRFNLPARWRYICSWTAYKPSSSHVVFFRYLSRHSAPNVCLHVSSGSGDDARDRAIIGKSLDWSPSEHRRDVRGDDLDVPGLDAAGMGAGWWCPGFHAAWFIQLLDEQLLGRRRGRNRCGIGIGRVTTNT